MTFPDDIVRVAITWTPDASEWPGEIAVNTFHLQHHHVSTADFNWDDSVVHVAGAIRSRLASAWDSIKVFHGPGYGPSGIKVSHLDSTGRALQEAIADPFDSPLTGSGSGSKVMPPEVACVLGLYGYPPGTFATNKGRKRGRIYLPYISPDCADGRGKIDPTAAGGIKDAWTAFFNDVEGIDAMDYGFGDAARDYYHVVVCSSVGPGGSATQVIRIVLDDHFDAQRRRQHQSPATVISGTITPESR